METTARAALTVAYERIYPVYIERAPGRIAVGIPDLPCSVTAGDEHALFTVLLRYEQTRGRSFQWELALAAETLTRRIVLPHE